MCAAVRGPPGPGVEPLCARSCRSFSGSGPVLHARRECVLDLAYAGGGVLLLSLADCFRRRERIKS